MSLIQSQDPLYFFGEEYRVYFNLVHIINAFKAIIGSDFAKLVFETVILANSWGYFGVISLIHVTVGLFFIFLSILSVYKERYILIIPLVILKFAELFIYISTIILLGILLCIGSSGKKWLRKLLLWKLRRLEYPDLNIFPYLLILMNILFIATNFHTLFITIKTIYYYKQKAMSEYLYRRRKILASFL
uniref:Uncharacterized protein n=1 Tax=Parastrongyloides trichosuri TaxID=131310 RepID=A0A0N4ZR08_PARTI